MGHNTDIQPHTMHTDRHTHTHTDRHMHTHTQTDTIHVCHISVIVMSVYTKPEHSWRQTCRHQHANFTPEANTWDMFTSRL